MSAPVCVAKGVDNIELKIREIARERDVPAVEKVPLARALYQILAEHYHAVAETICYVMGLSAFFRDSVSEAGRRHREEHRGGGNGGK